MKITKRQLRRIINEALTDPPPGQLEPEWFRSMKDAEDVAVGMVFGDGSQKLGYELPWEVRIVSIDGEYALYAMTDGRDRFDGEGREVAALSRGGSIRYGRQIG